ncbi:hypothetical protein Nepgr_031028 [Nepenthes gracilis]|uniref:WAT1-related protein n=1 Tax=Nepenthes gracilis TaxID=150966 RepID=A0AAD3TGJ3_NEPGR|nr:hypothetical protein Nepgr_031028 [Nepenthes gracilis]
MVMMRNKWEILNDLKPLIVMVIVQFTYAGLNFFYKLAANDGMNLRILVVYRFLFAAAFTAPLAFFFERKTRPRLTWTVLGQAFISGLLGGSLVQNLYLESLALTSATFAAAMANLIPALTFILAVCFRLESLGLRKVDGKAKVLGTLTSVAGAMMMTFYKGLEIKLRWTNPHFMKEGHLNHRPRGGSCFLGALMSVGSSLSYASWLIIQAKMNETYPSPYSTTALINVMASIQAVVFTLCFERRWREWKLGWNIRLFTVAYSGVISSGVVVVLLAWCMQVRGPLYASVFNPLSLILVAAAGTLVLDEKLSLGSVLGAVLIVCGLYFVLWGMAEETKRMSKSNHLQAVEIIASAIDTDAKDDEK